MEFCDIHNEMLDAKGIGLRVLRMDLNHAYASGNKLYKLKYHLAEARSREARTLVSFGGAWSNHLHAFSHAAREGGFASVAVVRGNEQEYAGDRRSEMLADIAANGTEIMYLDRDQYRYKEEPEYQGWLLARLERPYLIPEGGGGERGFAGCEEFARDELLPELAEGEQVVLAAGTGVTAAGIVAGLKGRHAVKVIPVLKGIAGKMEANIAGMLGKYSVSREDPGAWELLDGFHFGGYAKVNSELAGFVRDCSASYGLPLDYVYTGKAFYGLIQLVKNDCLDRDSKVLFIHTGGLQGNRGFKGQDGFPGEVRVD